MENSSFKGKQNGKVSLTLQKYDSTGLLSQKDIIAINNRLGSESKEDGGIDLWLWELLYLAYRKEI